MSLQLPRQPLLSVAALSLPSPFSICVSLSFFPFLFSLPSLSLSAFVASSLSPLTADVFELALSIQRG